MGLLGGWLDAWLVVFVLAVEACFYGLFGLGLSAGFCVIGLLVGYDCIY